MADRTTTTSPDLKTKVRELYAKVQAQKAELEAADNNRFVTDGVFRYNNTGQPCDLRSTRSTSDIQAMAAFLIGRKRDHDEAGITLGLKSDFTWLGATLDQWIGDFKVRVAQLEKTKRRSELLASELALNALIQQVDPEFVAELRFAEISALVG